MTDLHCHLLPGMDDGAKDEQAAVDLICTSYKQGVRRIALTSHFLPDEMALDEFLSRRQAAYSRLLKALRQTEIPIGEIAFRLGAEVLYSPMLVELPSNLLCLEGTNLMLLEFREGEVPFGVEETVFRLQLRGIVPLLAHVERYRFVLEDPRWLYRWVSGGGYAQINASTILAGGRRSRLPEDLIRWNLVHVLASDAHSLHYRPQNLAEGLRAVCKRLGTQTAERLEENAVCLFSGGLPETGVTHMPQKGWMRWK